MKNEVILTSKDSTVTYACLGAVLVLALFLRLYGIDWGLPSEAHPQYSYHPDEAPTLVWARWLVNGEIIPKHFAYGGTFFYTILNAFVYFGNLFSESLGGVNLLADSILAGRYFLTAMALVTILLIYEIGRELYSERTGILAALFLAISPAHIVWAQRIRVDEIAALIVTVILFVAVKLLKREQFAIRYYVYAGIAIGVGIATRFPLGVFGLVAVVAHVLQTERHGARQIAASLIDRPLLVMYGVVTATFAIISPHTLIYFSYFIEGMRITWGYETDAFPDAIGRGPVIYQFGWLMLHQALGIPLYVAASGGLMFSVTRRSQADVLVLSAIIPYFLVLGLVSWVVVRYTLPLIPLLALMAGLFLSYLIDRFRRLRPGLYALLLCAILWTLAADLAYLKVESGKDVRDQASEWIQANIAQGAAIVTVENYVGDSYFNPVIAPSFRHLVFLLGGDAKSEALFADDRVNYIVLNEFTFKNMERLRDRHPSAAYREFYQSLAQSPYTMIKAFKQPVELFGIDFSGSFSAFDYSIVNPEIRLYRRH